MKSSLAFTSIPGLRVGHAQDEAALTGCTVVLCERGAVAGVDQRGGAPGTRETDALHPMHLVEKVHAVVLSGGSAFGLDAASGVVRYLEERGVGFDTGYARVPIVPAAILYDLGIGRSDIRPDAAMGYQACLNASSRPPAHGNIGAGMGCAVGKILGMGQAMKAGFGSAALDLGGGIRVAALAAVNAFGDIIDPTSGQILAGARSPTIGQPGPGAGAYFADTLQIMQAFASRSAIGFTPRQNTILGVVATNARLTKEQTNKVAQMAQDGLARTVRPAHTMLDGDTIFALSIGPRRVDVNIIGAFAAEAMAQAILQAVVCAQNAGGLPSVAQLRTRE